MVHPVRRLLSQLIQQLTEQSAVLVVVEVAVEVFVEIVVAVVAEVVVAVAGGAQLLVEGHFRIVTRKPIGRSGALCSTVNLCCVSSYPKKF